MPNMQMSLGHFIGQWLEILRKLSCQKLECRKAPSCKMQGMSEVVREMHATLLHACRIFIAVVKDVGEGSNYIVYHNPNYLN